MTSELVLASTPQSYDRDSPRASSSAAWLTGASTTPESSVTPRTSYRRRLPVSRCTSISAPSSAASPAPRQCFAYDDRLGQFTPAEGCMLHIENDDHLVDVSVLRMPPPAGAGYTVQLVGGGGAVTTDLPVPKPGAPLYGQQRVAGASGSIRSSTPWRRVAIAAARRASSGWSAGCRPSTPPPPGTTSCRPTAVYSIPIPTGYPAASDPR